METQSQVNPAPKIDNPVLNPDYFWAERYSLAFSNIVKKSTLMMLIGCVAFLTLAHFAVGSMFYTKGTYPLAISLSAGLAGVFIYSLIFFMKKRKDPHFEDALKQAKTSSMMPIGKLLSATGRKKDLKWLEILSFLLPVSTVLGALVAGGFFRGVPLYDPIMSALFVTLLVSSYILLVYIAAISYLIKVSVSSATYELIRREPEPSPEMKAMEKASQLTLFQKILLAISMIITILIFVAMILDPLRPYSDRTLPIRFSYPKTWSAEERNDPNGGKHIFLSSSKLDGWKNMFGDPSIGWIKISIVSPNYEADDYSRTFVDAIDILNNDKQVPNINDSSNLPVTGGSQSYLGTPKRQLKITGAIEVASTEQSDTDGSYEYWAIHNGELFEILVHMPSDRTERAVFEPVAGKIVESFEFRK